MPKRRGPRTPERNPLGLGANDRESSNTGSIEDTAYGAVASDPYLTGEPRKRFASAGEGAMDAGQDAGDDDDVPPGHRLG